MRHGSPITQLGHKGERQKGIRLWAAVLIAAVIAGVFALPWVVPVASDAVVSDSQAVGFSNRAAMLALAGGVGAMLLFARWYGRGATLESLVSVRAATKEQRVSPQVTVTVMAVTCLAVAALGIILQDRPTGDAAYFIDRLLRIGAGGIPYSQIEFSYGPLLIYPLLVLWRSLAWTGLSVYAVYYCWVAVCYVAGLAITVYILNRINVSRRVRSAALLVAGGATLLMPTLGVNYSPLRYLLPYALFIWVTGRLTDSTGGAWRGVLPILAAVVAAGVSPEMGMALVVAFVVALSSLVLRGHRAYLSPLLLLLAGVGVLAAALATTGAGTLGAFAGGAWYFPVLPGPPALIFVGTMLLLAWGMGASFDTAEPSSLALHLGWLALAVVLIVPALGRADFGHMFWNGLGAGLACMAVAGGMWNKAGTYLGVAAAVFLSAFSLYAAVAFVPQLIVIREQNMREGAVVIDLEAIHQLKTTDSVCFTSYLAGESGLTLATSGQLAPLYCQPASALSEADFRRCVRQMDTAQALILPTAEVEPFVAAAGGATPDSGRLVASVPAVVGGSSYGLLLWAPVTLKGRNAIFSPGASFGVVLRRDWVPREEIGEFTVLVRR
ncbi:MAG: hypothetical protein WBJ62_02425 [Coriobacteriia bacterium]